MDARESARSDARDGSVLLADKARAAGEIAVQAAEANGSCRRPFGERRRSLVFTADDIEYPAAGRWEACRNQPLADDGRVSEGSLVVAHGPSRLELVLVVDSATVTVSLVDANRYRSWRFVGHLLTVDGSHAIELTVCYQGVFATGAHPVAPSAASTCGPTNPMDRSPGSATTAVCSAR